MKFTQKLRRIQEKNDSLLCIGLDTDITRVPEHLFAWGDPIFEFNRRIIDATKDLVCAYKINLAFYEVHPFVQICTGTKSISSKNLFYIQKIRLEGQNHAGKE